MIAKSQISIRPSWLTVAALAVLCAMLVQRPSGVAAELDDWLVDPAMNQHEKSWVEQHLSLMDINEKIGQLLMIRAHSDKGVAYEQSVQSLIEKYQVGGLLFFQGTAFRQAELTNHYQAVSKRVPLFIAQDAEWGLGMRLASSTISYPRALTLGAVSDDTLVQQLGSEIGRQCRRLGVHINFAPVLDINNNPGNPVINDRSFGENSDNVTSKGWAYIQGLQGQRVLACGKHFPGHGDTDVDSHLELPIIQHDRQRLDSIELVPFQILCKRGLGSVMVAHLNIPALDPREHRPSTLSQHVVDGILRTQMVFDGLIFTDAMEMKGVTKYFAPGMADLEAFKAGNDVLLLPENVNLTVEALRKAVESGEITVSRLDASVRRILRTKYRLGLNQPQSVVLENLEADLNTAQAKELRRKLLVNSLVLVRDDQKAIPISATDEIKLATLAIGSNEKTDFQKATDHFASPQHFQMTSQADNASWTKCVQQLTNVDIIVVCLHGLSRSSKNNFGISLADANRLRRLAFSKKVILVHFGNPYALSNFDDIPTVIQAFEESLEAQEAAAQAVFGAAHMTGKLPVTASPKARYGQGIDSDATNN